MAEQKFEEAMKRLERIVQEMEEGELSLEESLKVFEEGMKLVKLCSGKLEEAEKKVTLLIRENGGQYVQAPFKPEAEGDGTEALFDEQDPDS